MSHQRIPKNWTIQRSTPFFTKENVPAALLSHHNTVIPKLLEDADSEFRPNARTRRNMMRMVIPFSSVTTQC